MKTYTFTYKVYTDDTVTAIGAEQGLWDTIRDSERDLSDGIKWIDLMPSVAITETKETN